MTELAKDGWIEVCGAPDRALEAELESAAQARVAQGKYSLEDAKYIRVLSLTASSGALNVSNEVLEKLRRLCQLWDVELRMKPITSHRKFVGPFIVAAKKLLFPIVRLFMKDYIRQQRAFNASCISLLAEIAQSQSTSRDTAEDEEVRS